MAVGYPTAASVPHSIINGFKKVAAVCLEADIDIPQIAAVSKAIVFKAIMTYGIQGKL